ncbi:MAG: DUF2190 family protein [Gammaproteobacteria bacterium]|nr:DUF2190 family protein [Gammaproteobacteria bacterium]
MANEAILRNRTGLHTFTVTVADGTAIAKGTIMKLSADPRTAAASSADNEIFIGIAMEDKILNSGITDLTVGRGGIWDMKDDSAGVTLGKICMIKGANLIADTDATSTEMGQNIGLVLETASASEVVQVLVNF